MSAKKNRKKSEYKFAPITLKEEPSFQQVMASIRKRRKENAGKQHKTGKGKSS